jgi:Voltage gated chloride channel
MPALQVARPLVKTIAAAVSLGTGASLGPEGPSVEIGKAFADGLGSVLRSRPRHMLSLMAAGSGAGRLQRTAYPILCDMVPRMLLRGYAMSTPQQV